MIIKRITSPGIAHHSYFVGAVDYAAVIDPRRDCDIYLDLAKQHNLKIKYILETHRNEDYVIGSLELGRLTGAEIYHGPGINWGYGNTLIDGDSVEFDNINLSCIHTPGHTDESMSYALKDLDFGARVVLFTGDTLFVGDVGRVDLKGESEISRMASALYESLFNRIMPLGDEIIICPAHGNDSVCGGHIASRDESTIGIERNYNPVLKKNREEFVRYKISEKLDRPPYFRKMEEYNLSGPPLLRDVLEPGPMSPGEVLCEVGNGAVVIDTRHPSSFAGAHIKNSYNIWEEGLSAFAGWIINYEKPIILNIEEAAHLEKSAVYLRRVGYDRIIGYLKNGIEGWYGGGFPIESFVQFSVHELKNKLDSGEKLTLVDVRGESEWETGHIEQAVHIYVGNLEEKLSKIPPENPVTVICSIGNRSGIGASVLERAGYKDISAVPGGMMAWAGAGFPITRREKMDIKAA